MPIAWSPTYSKISLGSALQARASVSPVAEAVDEFARLKAELVQLEEQLASSTVGQATSQTVLLEHKKITRK